jgi:hypothetical protein
MAAIAHDHEPARDPVLPRHGRPRHLVLVPGDGRASRDGVRRRATATVYRRRRLVVLAMLATLLVVTVATAGRVAAFVGDVGAPTAGLPAVATPAPAPGSPAAGPATRPGAGAVYVVQPGDTVWSVARRLQPKGDLRGLVDRIVARNGGAALRPGQALVVG